MVDGGPWLIVGLGNPGPEYERTRHNVGFLVVEHLAEGNSFAKHRRARAVTAEFRLGGFGDGVKVVLAKPLTFMNESGGAVKGLMDFYKCPIERTIVVHDELDLPFETLRVKHGGGDNGHNGLKSIRSAVGSGDFYRIRVGIGRPPGRMDPAAFVLKPWSGAERDALPSIVGRASDATESLVLRGLDATQNEYNVDPRD